VPVFEAEDRPFDRQVSDRIDSPDASRPQQPIELGKRQIDLPAPEPHAEHQ
jgi:hypothetical protein